MSQRDLDRQSASVVLVEWLANAASEIFYTETTLVVVVHVTLFTNRYVE